MGEFSNIRIRNGWKYANKELPNNTWKCEIAHYVKDNEPPFWQLSHAWYCRDIPEPKWIRKNGEDFVIDYWRYSENIFENPD